LHLETPFLVRPADDLAAGSLFRSRYGGKGALGILLRRLEDGGAICALLEAPAEEGKLPCYMRVEPGGETCMDYGTGWDLELIEAQSPFPATSGTSPARSTPRPTASTCTSPGRPAKSRKARPMSTWRPAHSRPRSATSSRLHALAHLGPAGDENPGRGDAAVLISEGEIERRPQAHAEQPVKEREKPPRQNSHAIRIGFRRPPASGWLRYASAAPLPLLFLRVPYSR